MPFTNTTHTSASQTDSDHPAPSGSTDSNSNASPNPIIGQTYAGELYYGMGRFLRNKWDYLHETFWKDSVGSSPEEIARKQRDIYVAGLKECIAYLKPAIENVRKNPHDPASLGKVDDLAQHYAVYVNVHPTMEWHVVQQEFFQSISDQVERLSDPSLKRKLKMLLPVLAMGFSEQENKKSGSSVQEDEYSMKLSQAYYYPEGSNFKKLPKLFSSAKDKRSVERTSFPAVFDLNSLNGSNGFTVQGVTTGDGLGISVRTAGDINGDNITDLLLGAWFANSYAGASYVIFGSREGFGSIFNLTNLNGSNGFTVPGVAANGQLGRSVSMAGDLNGDGVSDLILGVYNATSAAYASYVIFGSRERFESPFNLTNLNGTNGFAVSDAGSGLGISVSTAGDINGDNITDLVLGAYGENSSTGASYVIFGSRGGFGSIFNLTTLNGTNGFTVPGMAASSNLGWSVSTAGDINGDGISDLVLGAYGVNSYAGASYVIFGSREGFASPFNLNSLNGTNGFTIPGVGVGDLLGTSVSTAGDTNGDGVSDLVLGARGANSDISGASYVIFGSQGGFGSIFNLTTLNGTNGFTVPGVVAGGWLGESLSTAGDINGDGISDLVLGAWKTSSVGASYVIFGIVPTPTPTPTPGSTPIPSLTVDLDILSNGTLILKLGQLPITDQDVISVEFIQGGYLTIVSDPLLVPIQNFTYFELKNEQIRVVRNGTGPLNITLGFDNELGEKIFFTPVMNFFNTNNPTTPSVPIAAVVGSTVGALVAIGLGVFGIFKYRQHQEQEENVAQSAGQRLR